MWGGGNHRIGIHSILWPTKMECFIELGCEPSRNRKWPTKRGKWTRKKAEKGRQAMRKLKIDYNSIINIYQLWSTKTQSVVTLRVKVWTNDSRSSGGRLVASDFSGRSHYGQSWISGPSLKNKMGVSKNAGVVSIPQNIQFMFFNQKNHGKIGFFRQRMGLGFFHLFSNIFGQTQIFRFWLESARPPGRVAFRQPTTSAAVRQLCRENILKSLEEQCTNHTKIW